MKQITFFYKLGLLLLVTQMASANPTAFIACGNKVCESQSNENSINCPMDCDPGVVTSYNYETVCTKDSVIYRPENLSDLQGILAEVSKSSNPHLRFLGSRHSISSLVCGKGNSVLVENFNRIIGVGVDSSGQNYVEVEAGVKLGDLSDFLHQKGYSLGFAFPAYHGLTMAGLFATGAHGSSRVYPGISSQTILEMTVLSADGKKHLIGSKNPRLLKAFKVHLGLLGFVHSIKLKIEPQFNLEMRTTMLENENQYFQEGQPVNLGSSCDSESIAWFPYINKAVKFCGTKTTEAADPTAASVLLGSDQRPSATESLEKIIQAFGGKTEAAMLKAEELRFAGFANTPPYVVLDQGGKEQYLNRVVGPSHKILISKPMSTFRLYKNDDISFAFPLSELTAVSETIRRFVVDRKLGLPIIGVFLRFAKSDGGSYLSHIEGGKSGQVFVLGEFATYKYFNVSPDDAVGLEQKKMLEEKINSLVGELVLKHSVKFHWGKNTNQIFTQANVQKNYGKNLQEFKKIRKQFDPHGMFSNELLDSLFQLK